MDMNQANILVCDDEVEVADLLKHVLEREGFAVTCCHSGDAALTLLNAQVFDLAILDIMMPGIDGFEVCRQIRGGAAGSNTDMPIVFLSAKTEEFDKVLGFTLGADDYVTKPFKARELVARLKARLRGRSAAPAPSDVLSVSGIELDETNHTAALHGCELSLTPKEFDCLAELLRAGGAPVSSKALFENVWDEEYTSSSHNAVMVYIRRLRKKLAEVDSSEELIVTVWGVGYRIPEKRRG